METLTTYSLSRRGAFQTSAFYKHMWVYTRPPHLLCKIGNALYCIFFSLGRSWEIVPHQYIKYIKIQSSINIYQALFSSAIKKRFLFSGCLHSAPRTQWHQMVQVLQEIAGPCDSNCCMDGRLGETRLVGEQLYPGPVERRGP